MKKIGLLLFIITAVGCSREPIDGTVYVIKGDGKIIPAAAISVYALPFESRNDFDFARNQLQSTYNALALKEFVSEVCGVFPEENKKQIEYNIKQAERYSEACKSETEKTVSLTSNNKDPVKLESLLDRKRMQRGKTVGVVEMRLKQKSLDSVRISFDYQVSNFGGVSITNNSKFWVTTGTGNYPKTTAAFVEGIRIMSCNFKPKIAPDETYKIDLGQCSGSDTAKKLIAKGAKICKKYAGDYDWSDPVLCKDDFGLEKYDSSVSGRYRKGDWIFASKSTKETALESIDSYEEINFMELALQSSEIKNLDREIAAIESDLRKSQLSFNNLNACELIQSALDNLENLICPALDSKRDEVKSFVATVSSLGVSVRDVPSYQLQDEKEFAISQATAIMTTNIDGKFILDNPTDSKFLLYTEYQDNFNTIEWMVPVGVDVKTIELNNNNAR